MLTLSIIALLLGTAIALVNMYFSAICTLAHRLREGHWPPVVPVGIPVVGTALLLLAMLLAPSGSGILPIAAVLALVDTGGPLFTLAFVRYRRRRRLSRAESMRLRLP